METEQEENLPFVTQDIDVPSKLNTLIYGPPGIGKTVLAGTASLHAPTSPVLYIDVEGGSMSMRDFYDKRNIRIVRPTVFDRDMESYYTHLASPKNKFRTVVIDSGTEVQKLSMQCIMQKLYESRPDKIGSSPSLQEWGKNSDAMRKFVRFYRDLPINVIILCLQQEVKDEMTGQITVKPSFSGKLPDEICGMMDIVGKMSTTLKTDGDRQELSRCILFQPQGSFLAKDRSNRLPAVLHDPTIEKIYTLAITPPTKEE